MRWGRVAGISLNPPTPLDALTEYLDLCDLVLVMSVMPGFGGQEFEPVALEKLRRLRAIGGPRLLLSVDGGVNLDTVGACAEAGADLFVTGSALFSQDDYGRFIERDDRAGQISEGSAGLEMFQIVLIRPGSTDYDVQEADSGKSGYSVERAGSGRGRCRPWNNCATRGWR